MKYLILLFCLFFPLKHFEVFHVLLILLLAFYLILEKKFIANSFLKFLLGVVVFIWVSNFIRSLALSSFGLRDYIEVIRFIPLLLLLAAGIRFDFKRLQILFFSYVTIDLLISFSQFLDLGFGGIFTAIYGSEFHAGSSLGISSRALGLSSGPGQHGAIMALFYVFFLYSFLYKTEKKLMNILGLTFSIVAILLSQSQTSFIAIIVSSCFIIFYTIIRGNGREKKKSFLVFGCLLLGGMTFFYVFLDELRYLYTLIELGAERNSFQRRLGKSDFIWDLASSSPGFLLIGYGKDFFGTLSRAMDNEYLYVFFIYGFIVGFALLIMGFIFMVKVLIFKNKYPQHYLLITFIMVVGLIIAFPTSFFTEPRIIILLAALFLMEENKPIQTSINNDTGP